MEKSKETKKNKKNMLPIILVVIAIIVVIVVVVVLCNKGSKEVTANLGEPQWLNVGDTLNLKDGDNKIKFTVTSEQDLVKTNEDYEYEVSYVLTVNDQEYTGTHKFGNGYSVHNESNEIPYHIDLKDFDNNKVQVAFTVAQYKESESTSEPQVDTPPQEEETVPAE